VESLAVDCLAVTPSPTSSPTPSPTATDTLRITTASPLPLGAMGQPYSVQLEATGGTPPYSWSVTAGGLPAGLLLNANTGVISGTPSAAGTFGFTIQVQAARLVGGPALATASQVFAVAQSPASGSAGLAYSLPIHIDSVPGSGGADSGVCASYSIVSGSLPAGLTLNTSTGVVSGTPTNGGTYTFTIGCWISGGQNNGQTAAKDFTITIDNPLPTISLLTPSSVRVGSPTFTLAVSGTNFVLSSTVRLNGSARPTTYVSANSLAALIGATDIASAGVLTLTVSNPAPSGGVSGPGTLVVYPNLPPTAAPAQAPLANSAGWNTGGVLVNWNWVDQSGYGLDTSQCKVSTPVTVNGVSNLAETCPDRTGNMGVATYTVKIDTISPAITARLSNAGNTPYIAGTWTNQTVTVHYACDDTGGSGVQMCSTDQVISVDGITTRITGTATDRAGNVTNVNVGPVQIDQIKPSLNPVVTPNPVLLNSVVTVLSGAVDALSGILTDNCGVPVTNRAGQQSVICTATDKAGNTNTALVTYTVNYSFSGYLAPVKNPNAVNMGEAGRTYPLKWRLRDANGAYISTLSAVRSIAYKRTSCGAFTGDPTDARKVSSPGDTRLHYDAASNQFIYNWETPEAGCYTLFLTLDSGQTYPAYFNLSKE